jgi:hypothetical protein
MKIDEILAEMPNLTPEELDAIRAKSYELEVKAIKQRLDDPDAKPWPPQGSTRRENCSRPSGYSLRPATRWQSRRLERNSLGSLTSYECGRVWRSFPYVMSIFSRAATSTRNAKTKTGR